MRAFVTGAASPLGRALVSVLTRRGDRVVGQVRRLNGVERMRRLGAEPLVTDLTQPDVLRRAMEGCQVVFHLAGYFDFWSKDETIFEAVNVEALKNTIAAAIVAKVPRVVYCSSAVTIGEPPGDKGHEWTPHRGYTRTHVERSKLAGERLALKLRAKGIEVVVANPGLVVAPGDTGWVGRFFAEGVAGRRHFATEQPMGWVWVNDAAAGLIKVQEHGKDGERYILCGDTLSPREMLERVAMIAGSNPPLALPPWLALTGAAASSMLARPFGRRPRVSMDEARFTSTGFRVDGSHVTTHLGLHYTPLGSYLPPVVHSYRSAQHRFER
jgi:dihydroflavonol-4-reductase